MMSMLRFVTILWLGAVFDRLADWVLPPSTMIETRVLSGALILAALYGYLRWRGETILDGEKRHV